MYHLDLTSRSEYKQRPPAGSGVRRPPRRFTPRDADATSLADTGSPKQTPQPLLTHSVDHLWTTDVATAATCAAPGVVSNLRIRCFRRSAPTRRPGGQGVAGSNPVSPTGRDGSLIWRKYQVND